MLGNTQTVCWLSLDELDDEPVTFVRYVLCAFQEVVDDFWVDAANWMEGRLQPDITITLNYIINELIRIDRPLT
jgi:ATP/maltotriose-dependent transcriptional regulator MalT